jgi:hypothetical protein
MQKAPRRELFLCGTNLQRPQWPCPIMTASSRVSVSRCMMPWQGVQQAAFAAASCAVN